MHDAVPPAPSPAEPPREPHGAPLPPGAVWAHPREPRATTALVLGIVASAGGLVCYLPALCGPVAIVFGWKSMRAIRDEPRLRGHGEAMTGFILGILATLLLVVMMAIVGFMIWLAITHPEAFDE